MDRIGILTFQFAHNYGALLQAYALKRSLTDESTSVEIINYMPNGLWENYSINPIYAFKKRQLKKLLSTPRRIKQVRLFSQFQKSVLQIGTPMYQLSKENVKTYNGLIVGSDQVWSDSILPDTSPYFFEGVESAVKMSYAASFGTDELSETVAEKIKRNLVEFGMVTVREKVSIAMIKAIAPECQVNHVCDPVFLLNAETWRSVYQQHGTNKLASEDYILYVDLRNDPDLIQEAKKLRDTTGMKVVCIHPTCWRVSEDSFIQLYNAGPLEYLRLVDQAQYVVTNSFHAVAFSMIFKKKIVHSADRKLGARVEDLLHTFSIEGRNGCIDCGSIDVSNSEFVEHSRKILKQMREIIKGGM